jgi:tubulin polyglutamylase TTLL6/13
LIFLHSDCQYPVVSKVAKKFNWKLQNSSDSVDWDIFWTDNVVQPEFLLRMEPHQKVNHFPGMFNLSRKNLMGRNLMKMRKKYPEDYSFFPLTWMLPV